MLELGYFSSLYAQSILFANIRFKKTMGRGLCCGNVLYISNLKNKNDYVVGLFKVFFLYNFSLSLRFTISELFFRGATYQIM